MVRRDSSINTTMLTIDLVSTVSIVGNVYGILLPDRIALVIKTNQDVPRYIIVVGAVTIACFTSAEDKFFSAILCT